MASAPATGYAVHTCVSTEQGKLGRSQLWLAHLFHTFRHIFLVQVAYLLLVILLRRVFPFVQCVPFIMPEHPVFHHMPSQGINLSGFSLVQCVPFIMPGHWVYHSWHNLARILLS